MRRILFVDDEPHVLAGLQRALSPLRSEWEMGFADSGVNALKALAEARYDVLITDIRMPGMSGLDLLAESGKLYPDMLRIAASGASDRQLTLRSTQIAHQYVAKPYDSMGLRTTIERAFNLRVVLEDPALRRTVASLKSLPSMPSTYMELMDAVQNPEASAKDIGGIVARDVAMVSKVLQLVNSAFFGIKQTIVDPVAAVIHLGADTVSALALQVSVFSQFSKQLVRELSIDTLQEHSRRVAAGAKQVAVNVGLTRLQANDCVAAGLLHDVGKLVLAANFPADYRRARELARDRKLTASAAEGEIFGTSHAEAGAYLLWLWGLPDALIEAVALHHKPVLPEGWQSAPAAAVYVSDYLDNGGCPEDCDASLLALARRTNLSVQELCSGVSGRETATIVEDRPNSHG